MKNLIKAELKSAMVNKDTLRKNLFSTLLGEIETAEKNEGQSPLSVEKCEAIVRKFIKGAREMASYGNANALIEIEILNGLVPTELTTEQITEKVKEAIASGCNNLGAIMKYFAGTPADKKKVSQIAKAELGL
jgi:uncharacterized protein YqeY